MIEERVLSYLDTIYEAARDAHGFVRDMPLEEFLKDVKSQLAVMMCFVRIGESTRKIDQRSPQFIVEHPEFPWHQMRGLRNRGIHEYDTVDFDEIYATARNSLPELLKLLEALAPEWEPLPPEPQITS